MSMPVQTTTLFIVNLLLQVGALTLLPMTQGFSRPIPALLCMIALTGSMWCMARMIVGGIGLGLLFPLVAAAVPLAAIAVGIVVFGETASAPKVGLLVAACSMIGLASRF